MGIMTSKVLDRELTAWEELVLKAMHESMRDSATASICFDLRPYVFRHDDKFVFVLNCNDGPCYEMTLVNSVSEAIRVFGRDTFNNARLFDPVTKACYMALLNEPVYIVRTFRPQFVRKSLDNMSSTRKEISK